MSVNGDLTTFSAWLMEKGLSAMLWMEQKQQDPGMTWLGGARKIELKLTPNLQKHVKDMGPDI